MAGDKQEKRFAMAKYFLSVIHRVSLAALVLLSACARHADPQHVEFLAMGTTISIDAIGLKPAETLAAIDAARNEFQRLGREWYPWEDGELKRLNTALGAGDATEVSPLLAELLSRCQKLQRLSGGAFDPAVGSLVELWGFHRADRQPEQPWPSEQQLSAWRDNHPTIADLTISDRSVSSSRKDLLLDLGAIGKGRAVDAAIELLRQRGINRALVNAGGNMRASGRTVRDSEDRPWRIAIRSPRGQGVIGWLELTEDESVSTSGDYERFAERDGKRVHHLLDPRTGQSATHTIAVTVLAPDATLADAASTAIFVAGPTEWRAVARNLGIRHVLRMDADGSIVATRDFAVRLHAPGSDAHQIPWRTVDL